jgi:hypothetical protein
LESPAGRSPDDHRAPIATSSAETADFLGEDRARRRRRNRRLAAAAVLLAGAVLAAVVLLGSRSQPPKSSGTDLPAGQTTSSVTRRSLTESSTVEGTLGYGATLELFNRLAGTFTWLPPVGAVIGRDGTLYRLDNLPVVLMYGSVPAYRTLKQGVSDGPDVAELNRNLIDLGFDPYGAIGNDEYFGEATAAAVERWQEAKGLPETGEVELGRIIFARGARRVTAVHVALGQDPPAIGEAEEAPAGESPPEEVPSGGAPGEEPAAEEPSENDASSKESPKDGPRSGEGAEEPASEEPADKSGEEKEGAGSGPGSAAAAEAVLGTTSTKQLVQLQVSASEQGLARVGESAPVTLPDGKTVKAHITAVGTVAEAAEGGGEEGGGGEPTIAVTLALGHPVTRLDKAPVSVELLKQVRRNVLAVPATALVATAGGGYAVEALKGTHRVTVAVTPGMFADGYVQIEGAGVHAGLKVIEPAE